MIKEILQFLKKQQLANKLAKYDCLFIINKLSVFKSNLKIANLFRNSSGEEPSLRVRKFLEAENNPLLYVLAEEISARSDIIGDNLFIVKKGIEKEFCGEFLFKNTYGIQERKFYQDLLYEIIESDFPKLHTEYDFFDKRLDSALDMRFYGAELETLFDDIRDLDRICALEVDWIKTNKEELWMGVDEKCFYTQELPKIAQRNLSQLFAHLLFDKSVFISYWNAVVINESNRVSLADFDSLYAADAELKYYALDSLKNDKTPRKPLEFKMQRALKLLKAYCRDINLCKEWESYFQKSFDKEKLQSAHGDSFKDALQKNGIVFEKKQSLEMTNPQEIAYLLDSKRHKKDPRFKKSSIFYWGPLLVVIYILYKFL